MRLEAGARLGFFEVLSPLGAGGMGEVYRARDTKLGREVALKVLPDAFAQDPERLARFDREARALASLNHSGIAGIHGLEECDGVRFLVLELVPGTTLAERLTRGPLPVRAALDAGRQIAEALGAAHERGILHRDLKPSNVQVTLEGAVKLLDFGLAKALQGDTAAPDLSQSPTVTAAATREGVILGTAPYMSPEQARGESLDKRTDVWAFGCVLYEALCGRRAFPASTVADTIAAVLEREPDWQALPDRTPAIVRSLLRRALQKDRAHRLRDIVDAQIELEEALAVPGVEMSGPLPPPELKAKRRARVVLGLSGLLVVVGLAGWLVAKRSGTGPLPVRTARRFAIQLPPSAPLQTLVEGNALAAFAVSPDGSRLVYVSELEGRRRLYLRELDQIEPVPIDGTEGGYHPFFSPDGQWLGFAAHGKLKKVRVRGGEALTLCDAPALRGAAWAPNDTILFAGFATGLSRVSAAGGTPEVVTTPDTARGENHRWPLILPGGRAALFAVHKGPYGRLGSKSIALLSFATGHWRELIKGTHPRYAATGHVLFWRPSSLWAQPFDLERLAVTGEAVPVLEDVNGSNGPGVAYAEVSADGSLFFVPRDKRAAERRLVWRDRQGREELLPAAKGAYNFVQLSPDGRRIASTIVEGEKQDLWVYDISRREWARLTTSGNVVGGVLAWAPDGNRIAYQTSADDGYALPWIASDGSGSVEPLLASPDSLVWPTSISPDGKELAFFRFDPPDNWNIWILPLDGERKPRPFLATHSSEGGARFSPDGRWLAYDSNETGRDEVYVRAYPGPGRAWRVSADGGGSPIWGRDGRELFYLSLDGDRVLAVGVETGPELRAQPPISLFKGRFENFGGISPDGQRFLMLKGPDAEPAPPQIVVIPDWFDELRERLRQAAK